MNENLYWLGLSLACPWFRKSKDIADGFGGAKKLWEADYLALKDCNKLSQKNIDDFLKARSKVNLWAEWEKLQKKGVSILTLRDTLYPDSLKNIFDPPPILYVCGSITPEDHTSIAIVGSRKSTFYGQRVAGDLAADLANVGVTVISGLARGIDTFALKGAVDHGGRAIAVLGSGVDVIYPRENQTLAKKIAENGAIISEFPIGTPPRPWHFPLRNRIISGLSLGVVVVEAANNSGSLITADSALEQGREVFAVPGPIYSEQSKGCLHLIRQGATLLRGVEDILEEIAPQRLFQTKNEETRIEPQLTQDEKKILSLISFEPILIDKIIEQTNITAGQVSAILMYLELKGLVLRFPGKKYIRKE